MNTQQLIADWHSGKIKTGEKVKIKDPIWADCHECWLAPNNLVQDKKAERELFVQVIGDIHMLFQNLPGLIGGDLMYHFEEAVIEGEVCKPTISGYHVAIKEITSLFVTSGDLDFVGLGKEEPYDVEITLDDNGVVQKKKVRRGELD